MVEHDDPVGVLDGGEAVGNHDRGAVGQDDIEAFLNLGLGERIDTGGCLVEDHDRGVLDQDARQGDELALPHREGTAVFTDNGLQPFRERCDPVTFANCHGGRQYLVIAGIGLRVADVVGYGAGKEEWRLGNNAQLLAIFRQIERPDRATIDQQITILKLVEARDQLAERGLASAGVSDDGQCLSARNRQIEVIEHLRAIGIGEGEIAEFDFAPHVPGILAGRLDDLGIGVDQREDSLGSAKPLLELGPE